MISIKINSTSYSIPTNWMDLTWNKYVAYLASNTTGYDRVSIITGINIAILISLPYVELSRILSLISFLDDESDLPKYCDQYDAGKFVLGNESYAKVERAKLAIKEAGKQPLLAGAKIVKIYLDEDILEQSVVKVYNKVAFFLSLFQTS